uniref:SHSP domain-containing protein n=1 Tax=Arcella intermedia TaxID=1963864 RepID=A0A6B2LR20_9EUKA
MSLLWDPWGDFGRSRERGFYPRLDIQENENQFILHLEIPGINEKDVKLSLRGGVLDIAGEKPLSANEDKLKYLHRERELGKFARRIQLPAGVDVKHISASTTNGVLKIVVQKPEKERNIEVPIARL